MNTLTKNPDQPSNAMSSQRSRNTNRFNACQNHFDELDAANCSRCANNNGIVNNRQRRNARRAAAFRNQNAMRPVPVIPVSRPSQKASFKLPGNQVWVTKIANEWAAKTVDTNDAIALKSILNGIPEITSESKIFRLLIGFVAESDGTFGLVDGVTGNVIPDPPIIGRLGFQKNTYRSRDFDLGGKSPDQLSERAIVWCLDDHRKDAKRVRLANYWLAVSRPAPLMPPENFLDDGNQ